MSNIQFLFCAVEYVQLQKQQVVEYIRDFSSCTPQFLGYAHNFKNDHFKRLLENFLKQIFQNLWNALQNIFF